MKFFPWQIFRSINKKNQNKSLRPKFHFSTPKGWCNDPNGFSQFGDKIHLFFQHHPYSTQWGPMHWGHAVTSDMLTWEQLPIALAPDTTADCKGCFSGTALEKDGYFYMVCVLKRETREENGYTAALVDYGIDFYAPQTTKLKDGRVIMIGWMQAFEVSFTLTNQNAGKVRLTLGTEKEK